MSLDNPDNRADFMLSLRLYGQRNMNLIGERNRRVTDVRATTRLTAYVSYSADSQAIKVRTPGGGSLKVKDATGGGIPRSPRAFRSGTRQFTQQRPRVR